MYWLLCLFGREHLDTHNVLIRIAVCGIVCECAASTCVGGCHGHDQRSLYAIIIRSSAGFCLRDFIDTSSVPGDLWEENI